MPENENNVTPISEAPTAKVNAFNTDVDQALNIARSSDTAVDYGRIPEMPIDEAEVSPNTVVNPGGLTRRGRAAVAVGGVLVTGGMLAHGVSQNPSNPIGEIAHDVVQSGINVVSMIPGVDTADATVLSPEQSDQIRQGVVDFDNLPTPDADQGEIWDSQSLSQQGK